MNDAYNLRRFEDAQENVYEHVCVELRTGRKSSHWMWFIFPQLKGLGVSRTADRFGISSRDEAQAYLAHPVLGTRLRECAGLMTLLEGRSIETILGYPDDLKFKSSMTLFAHVTADNEVFLEALDIYYDGAFDQRTLDLLR